MTNGVFYGYLASIAVNVWLTLFLIPLSFMMGSSLLFSSLALLCNAFAWHWIIQTNPLWEKFWKYIASWK